MVPAAMAAGGAGGEEAMRAALWRAMAFGDAVGAVAAFEDGEPVYDAVWTGRTW